MTINGLVIERGIPLPPRVAENSCMAVLRVMEIGESVFIANRKQTQISNLYGRLKPKRFACRTWESDGVKGIRIWRLV